MSKYKGWCWAELAEVLGHKIEEPCKENDWGIKDSVKFQSWLRKNAFETCTEANPKVVKECKEFLTAINEQENGFSGPLWEGLLKIQNDWSFMRYFIVLVGFYVDLMQFKDWIKQEVVTHFIGKAFMPMVRKLLEKAYWEGYSEACDIYQQSIDSLGLREAWKKANDDKASLV